MNEIKPQRNVVPLSEAESALKALYLTTLMSSGAYSTPVESYKPPKYMFLGYHQTKPKIGRNEPCPCNSGKKYKKCCGKEEV